MPGPRPTSIESLPLVSTELRIATMAALNPVETLRRVPFFGVLPSDELNALAAHCVVRSLSRDEILVGEGDPCEGLFVVQSGAIKIFKMAENGREQVLVIERPGSTVGELPILTAATSRPQRPPSRNPRFCSYPNVSSWICVGTTPKLRSRLSGLWRGGSGT